MLNRGVVLADDIVCLQSHALRELRNHEVHTGFALILEAMIWHRRAGSDAVLAEEIGKLSAILENPLVDTEPRVRRPFR